MVIKLIKNEIRETYRSFTPIFIMAVIGAVLTALIGFRLVNLTYGAELSDMTGLIIGMGVLAIYGLLMATGVMTIIALVRIAYNSLYKRNGYRLFTYPATSIELYTAKLVVIVFWSIVTGVVIGGLFFASIAIVTAEYNFFSILGEALGELFNMLFGTGNVLGGVLMIFNFAVSSLVSVALLLFAGSVGNSSIVRGKRGLITFLIFFAINMLMSFVNGLITPSDAILTYNSLASSNGLINNTTQMISLLRDAIYFILLTVGTIWFWDNKLEIL